jgi:hypothetical protein
MGRKYGFSLSWKKALRMSAAKGRISLQITIYQVDNSFL